MRQSRWLTRWMALAVALAAGCSIDSRDLVGGHRQASLVSDDLVIGALYPGGGNTGSIFNQKYVVLVNRGATAVTLDAKSLQYATAAGAFNSAGNVFALPNVSIPASGSYLVGLASVMGGTPLPQIDTTASLNPAVAGGKIALVSSSALLDGCGSAATPCAASAWIDLIGWGTATQGEGTVVGTLGASPASNTKAYVRAQSGCVDTGNNASDFLIEQLNASSVPQSTGAPGATCAVADLSVSLADAATGDAANDLASDLPSNLDASSPLDGGALDSAPLDGGPVWDPLAGELVIASIYPGGGNSGAVFERDYVVIYNRGASAVSLAGLTLQYASAANSFSNVNNAIALPSENLPAGGSYLIAFATGSIGAALPGVDLVVAGLNLSATGAKLALTRNALNGCGTSSLQCALGSWIDLVGWGTASQFVTSAALAVSANNRALERIDSGCRYTPNNGTDFALSTLSTGIPPRSSASSPVLCGGLTDGGTMIDLAVMGDAQAPSDLSIVSDLSSSSDMATSLGGRLVIASVYPSGGNSGATFDRDYVVLTNVGATTASLAGLQIQYAPAGSAFSATANKFALPSATVAPGRSFLVALAAGSTGNGAGLPSPDATTSAVNLATAAGKIALSRVSASLSGCGTTGSQCSPSAWIDFVGWGSAAQSEGDMPAATLSPNAQSLERRAFGCVDSDVNAADFDKVTLTVSTPPRNSASSVVDCSALDLSPAPSDMATNNDLATPVVVDSGISDFARPVDATMVPLDMTAAQRPRTGCAVAASDSTSQTVLSLLCALFVLLAIRRPIESARATRR